MLTKSMRENYDLLKEIYENYNSVQERLIPIVHHKFKKSQKLKVLEIGCGTGITTDLILKINNEITLTSIDADSFMAETCKNKFKANNNVNFVVSDALEYLNSSLENSYDLIVTAFTIHNFSVEYREEIHSSIYRKLKTNGIFLNIDKFVSDEEVTAIEGLKYRIGKYIEVLSKLEKYELLTEWLIHYIRDYSPNYRMTFDKTEKQLRTIGYRKISFDLMSEIQMLGIIRAEKN